MYKAWYWGCSRLQTVRNRLGFHMPVPSYFRLLDDAYFQTGCILWSPSFAILAQQSSSCNAALRLHSNCIGCGALYRCCSAEQADLHLHLTESQACKAR